MQVLKIPRHTFRQHFADTLREQVLSGYLRPGSIIVEARLAEQFGVSRGPLREAICQLTEEKLLVTKAYTGTHALESSARPTSELFALRTALEPLRSKSAGTSEARHSNESSGSGTSECQIPYGPATTASP